MWKGRNKKEIDDRKWKRRQLQWKQGNGRGRREMMKRELRSEKVLRKKEESWRKNSHKGNIEKEDNSKTWNGGRRERKKR